MTKSLSFLSTRARIGLGVALGCLLAGLCAVSASSAPAAAPSLAPVAVTGTVESQIQPDSAAEMATPAAPMSDAERARLKARLEAIREATSSNAGAGDPVGTSDSPATRVGGASRANLVTINRKNTRSSAVSSTLAEPAAANDSTEVFYNGNTYHSQSANRGVTWTAGAAIPAGPADAPNVCCDPDAIHHGGLDTTFHIMLYTNAALTNGVVRIFVRRGTIAGGVDCTYTIDPGGTANNVLPDYPHLATSNGFIYLSTNNITNGTTWTGAQVRRFNASQMANCQTAAVSTFTHTGAVGQRILTPVENASTTMYFGSNDSANSFRVFRWPESSAVVSQFVRPLSHGSNFSNPNCQGGTGNFDFVERSTSWSIAGFRLRGAVVPGSRVWFLWNAAQDASHPQAHLHSAIFTDAAAPASLTSNAVFNSAVCFAYPSLGANSSGDFGLSLAFGGDKTASSGSAARGGIGVDDSATVGNRFGSITQTASGTHNRSDGRFGDYFTVRRNDRCPATGWVGTNYGLSGGSTTSAHVNARYVEFQSSTKAACP